MPAPWRSRRRARTIERRADVPKPLARTDESTWYRTPDGVEHAFPVGSGYMRSRCKAARWTAAVELLEDDQAPTRPCGDCLAITPRVAPITESELRMQWGDR